MALEQAKGKAWLWSALVGMHNMHTWMALVAEASAILSANPPWALEKHIFLNYFFPEYQTFSSPLPETILLGSLFNSWTAFKTVLFDKVLLKHIWL